jgi:hypothetical protein
MKKKIRITRMVRNVTITNPKASSTVPQGWEISVRTDFQEGSDKSMEIYSARYYDSPEFISQIEPGMYVTIIYYQYALQRNKNRSGNHTIIEAEEIFIDQKKTKFKRTHFDFMTFKDAQFRGVVHKRIPELM